MRRVVLVVALLALLAIAGVAPRAVAADAAGSEQPRDLQALIDAASAGDEVRLDAGVYEGGVVIDKPLRLVGEGWPVVDGGGDGNVIEIEAPDVVIEGLEIRHSGDSIHRENAGVSANGDRVRIVGNRLEDVLFGVFLRGAVDSVVADNVVGAKRVDLARRGDGIRLWESSGSVVEGNQVAGGRDTVIWFSNDVEVRDNRVTDGRYGLHFMYSDDNVVEGNWLEGNSVGAFLMYSRRLVFNDNVLADNRGPSGYGLGLKDLDGVEAEGNRFVDNRVGIYLDNSPAAADVFGYFRNNIVAYNDIGVSFQPSVERNIFSENAFIDNREQVAVTGGGLFEGNEWTEDGKGNHWSDYAGYDADGDGVGDVPYRVEDLFSELTDDHPDLTFFAETPAARSVDAAARAFPVLRPEPKVVDDAPLVHMPDVSPLIDAPSETSRAMLVTMSAGLVALAALITVGSGSWSRRRHGQRLGLGGTER